MDPITLAAIISAGGGLLDTVIGAIGGSSEANQANATAQANRDAQLKIAADNLGLNYAQLKQQADQFSGTMKQRVKEWAASNKIDLASLAEKIRSSKASEGLAKTGLAQEQEKTNIGKAQFNITNDQAQAREKRMASLRQAFQTGLAATKSQPNTMSVAPTAAPTANKNMGAQSLTQAV